MGIWLRLKITDTDRIEYSVSWIQRIIFAAIGLTILLAITSATGQLFQRGNAVALFIVLVCAVSASYIDTWRFDRGSMVCVHRGGLPGLIREREFSLERASLQLLTQNLPAKRNYISLVLVLEDEKPVKLDMTRSSGPTRLEDVGKRLSEFCGLDFQEQTEG